jgi:hypothetical protein
MFKVTSFTNGKQEPKNEDYFSYSQNSFVIVDGATDKSGKIYKGNTSGEIISKLVSNECLSVDLNGVELVDHLNKKVFALYKKFKITKLIEDAKFRFTCGFICVRILEDKLIITYLGDLGFRINGSQEYHEVKNIDILSSNKRSKYIEETGDVKGSRDYILKDLESNFRYQNNKTNKLGYGVIDGTITPEKFIKVFEYDINNIKSLELFTDGYVKLPKEVSIDAWEDAYEESEREDPDKWIKYKSTKSKDDRTIAIIKF